MLKNILTASGYEVTQSYSFTECFNAVSVSTPDILIIDPLFPETEGIKTIKRLRSYGNFSIIALCEIGGEKAVVSALDAGADDFIKKPFLSGELLARVRVSIRKAEQLEEALGISTDEKYLYNGLCVEYDRHRVTVNNKEIHLTKNEFKILTLLCRYSGRVLTYDFLIKSVWGHQALGGNGILRVNITNLRKKIEQDSGNPQYLFTENGVGYRIAEEN